MGKIKKFIKHFFIFLFLSIGTKLIVIDLFHLSENNPFVFALLYSVSITYLVTVFQYSTNTRHKLEYNKRIISIQEQHNDEKLTKLFMRTMFMTRYFINFAIFYIVFVLAKFFA